MLNKITKTFFGKKSISVFVGAPLKKEMEDNFIEYMRSNF